MRNLAVFLAASIATVSQPIVASEAGSGSGERVVVLHGLARSADSMSRMAHALEKEMGRVAAGYSADLILLDANPLQDIRNTSRINAVILRGQLLDRGALDDMLAKVKKRYATKDKKAR